WQALAQGLGLLDGEHRLGLHPNRRQAEVFESREQKVPRLPRRFLLTLCNAIQVPVCVLFRTREGQKRVLWTSEGRSTTTPDSAFKREPDGFGKSARVGRIAGVAQG